MDSSERLYIFLEDYEELLQWKGDVIIGKPFFKKDHIDYILSSSKDPRWIKKIPIRNRNGDLIIKELLEEEELIRSDSKYCFDESFIISTTILRRFGWTHYTKPFLTRKEDALKSLKSIENSSSILAELFFEDKSAHEDTSGRTVYRCVASLAGDPSKILQVNQVGGSSWFKINFSDRWYVEIGGRERSIKSRNWFQHRSDPTDTSANNYKEGNRPKLILSFNIR